MPVLSSCLKDAFVSQGCFSINWLVKGWSFGVKFPNVSSRGGQWDFRICGFGQFLVSYTVCGFSAILSSVSGFRQQWWRFLCSVFYSFGDFGKDPAVLLKPVLFQGTTYIALHPFFRGIDDKSSLFSTHHFGRNGEGQDNIKGKDYFSNITRLG